MRDLSSLIRTQKDVYGINIWINVIWKLREHSDNFKIELDLKTLI